MGRGEGGDEEVWEVSVLFLHLTILIVFFNSPHIQDIVASMREGEGRWREGEGERGDADKVLKK